MTETPPKEEVKGDMGFDKTPDIPNRDASKADFITKEETMFKVDANGVAMPEKVPILLYDRQLDDELLEEGVALMAILKNQKAVAKIMVQVKNNQNVKIAEFEKKIEKEPDELARATITKQLEMFKTQQHNEEMQFRINNEVIEEGIKESREMLRELNKKKDAQIVEKSIEVIPCTVIEAYQAFEKGNTIEGEKTDDWLSDVISKKCANPKYSIDEAKLLKTDFKVAIKQALMKASNYKLQSYREVMTRLKLEEEKPLTVKKE
ncbi:MAG: hypothetical protein GY861_17590 [bacterium]|nr:hypothetical protein [bacterium]